CSSRRRHTSFSRDWSSDVCSSDLYLKLPWIEKARTGHYLLQHESLNSAAATDFIERMRVQQGYEYDEGDGRGDDEMECPQNIAEIGRASCRERAHAVVWGC